MPGWRLQYQGPDRIVQEFRRDWSPGNRTWEILEQRVTQTEQSVVLELEVVTDVPTRQLVRFANFFDLRDGRIASHRYYCCGEWDEATVRQIEAEAPKVEVKVAQPAAS
jgi:hypothetical protein